MSCLASNPSPGPSSTSSSLVFVYLAREVAHDSSVLESQRQPCVLRERERERERFIRKNFHKVLTLFFLASISRREEEGREEGGRGRGERRKRGGRKRGERKNEKRREER